MKGKPKLHILCELKLYIMNMKLIGRADLLSRTDPIGWLDLVTYSWRLVDVRATILQSRLSFSYLVFLSANTNSYQDYEFTILVL